MKKNKGFTLVEVLGVIVLLSIVFLISYTTILNTIKKSQDDIDNHTLSLITSATKDYMADRKDNYPEVNNNVFCIDINDLIDNNYIDEDTITAQGNSILSKTVKVTYKKENNSEYEVVGECRESSNFVKYLLKQTNDISVTTYEANSSSSHQMYTFEHEATEQTEALIDYRYIGNDPYNYVEFNDELWRIIGVFMVENDKGKKEKRIKIIRDEDLNNTLRWQEYYDNYVTVDWEHSNACNLLNGQIYLEFTEEARTMIGPAKYYLGDGLYYPQTASGYYEIERGNYKGNSEFNLYWIGNVGLMYPSDYMYSYANGKDACGWRESTGACTGYLAVTPDVGWLYKAKRNYMQLTINIVWNQRYNNGYVYAVHPFGDISVGNYEHARPVVYLKSKVNVVDGDGTKSNPYKLKI